MKKEKQSHSSVTTFIGPDARIEGTVEFDGAIRLDGKVEGKIESKRGTVVIGEQAMVNADIHVGTAIIMGHVKGTVEADTRIEISPPGRVEGDIHAPVISIDAGVIFNGNCETGRKPVADKSASSTIRPMTEGVIESNDTKIKNFPKNL